MPHTKEKPTGTDQKAAIWQERYRKASSNQIPMFEKWSEWYKMMYAVLDTKNMAPWRSKIYIPILSTKAWNMIAKFIEQEPGFEVTVRNEDSEELDTATLERVADKVQRKLEFDYHNPELPEPIRDKLHNVLVDAMVTGTGVGKVPWVMKKKEHRRHPTDGRFGEVDFEKDEITTTTIGYNDIEPVNIFNVFIAPSAVSLQQAPWVIIREFKTLPQLKAVNEESGIEVYKNLDSLKGVGSTSDTLAQYKKSRENLTSEQDVISADQTVDMVEIFECYERGKISTYAAVSNDRNKVGSRWLPIREQKNPYWHQKYPLVAFYVRKRPFSFWGEGIFETTQRLQSAANDVMNHFLDSWNLSNDGGMMIEETSDVEDFLVEPGFKFTYRGEKPTQWKFPEPNPNNVNLILTEIYKAIEQATISNYAAGTPISGLDKTQGTARGTMAIIEAATDMIQYMRDNFTQSIKQVGEMWLSNNRQFLNFDFPVPVLKDNKFEMEPLTPEELQLQMELRINDLEMQPISKQQRKENFISYVTQLVQLQTASINQSQLTQDQTQILFIDWHNISKELSKHFQVKSFQKQIMPNEEALAVQTEAADATNELEAAKAEEAEAEAMKEDALTEADIPDEEVLQAAEEALGGRSEPQA